MVTANTPADGDDLVPSLPQLPEQSGLIDLERFDRWMHDRLFANPPQPVTPFDAWQAGRAAGAAWIPVSERLPECARLIRAVLAIPASTASSDNPAVRWAIRELLGALPTKRDWLNPDVERTLRDAVAKS